MNDDELHPNGLRLDALVIGAGDDETRAHLASCAACSAHVSALTAGAEAFARDEAPRADAFVEGVRRREHATVRRIPWAGVASVLALAAGMLFFVRSGEAPPLGQNGDPVAEGPIRFKGGMQTAILVEHAGAQSRRTGELALEPGDRIRLEVALDHDLRLAAGVLADDGDWAELQPPSLVTTGTHYSEHAVTFEHDVPEGWVVVGNEEAVARARRTRDFHDVTTIRVHPKKP